MKSYLVILYLMPFLFIAQPEFSFDLYIEDALGNRDTVTIGYDPEATDGIDELFGEENIISQPWDSVLDVRIGDKSYTESNWLTENTYHTKQQILGSYCETKLWSNMVSVLFHAVNFPLKINWNNTLFEDSCRARTIFYGFESLIEFDVAGVVSPILYGDNLFIQPYSYNTSIQPEEFWVYHSITNPEYQIKKYSTSGKNIGVIQFLFQRDNPLSLNPITIIDFNVYPNPIYTTDGELRVSAGNNFKLIDLNGKTIKQGLIEQNKINLSNIVKGSYFLSVANGNMNHLIKIIIL